jgi:hypothetical protein
MDAEAGVTGPNRFNFSDCLQANAKARASWSARESTEGAFMIFRAVFWIGLVSLLTPHEPDLGLGRPGAGATLSLPASVLSASGLSRTGTACGTVCAGAPFAPSSLTTSSFEPSALRASLADIKAQIEAARAERI